MHKLTHVHSRNFPGLDRIFPEENIRRIRGEDPVGSLLASARRADKRRPPLHPLASLDKTGPAAVRRRRGSPSARAQPARFAARKALIAADQRRRQSRNSVGIWAASPPAGPRARRPAVQTGAAISAAAKAEIQSAFGPRARRPGREPAGRPSKLALTISAADKAGMLSALQSAMPQAGLAEAPSRPSRESLKTAESRRVASRSK